MSNNTIAKLVAIAINQAEITSAIASVLTWDNTTGKLERELGLLAIESAGSAVSDTLSLVLYIATKNELAGSASSTTQASKKGQKRGNGKVVEEASADDYVNF